MLLLAAFGWQAQAPQPNPDEVFAQAVEAQTRGDYQTAIRDYRSVLQTRPNFVEARVNLGAALVRVGQFEAGIEQYRAALPLVSDKTGVLLNIGLAYYKREDWSKARDQFAPLAKSRPRDVRLAILLGDTYLHLDDSASAVALMTPLAEENNQNPDFDFIFGSALIKAGKSREGVDSVEKAAEISHAADAYALAGSTALTIGDIPRARKDLDAAIAADPALPAAIYSLAGEARDSSGDAAAAEPAFREALKRDPNDAKANLYLGAILYKRREMDEARPYLERALKLDPKSPLARYENAMLNSTAGQYDAAAQTLEELTKDDPDWLEPHVELATLYYKLHRPKDGAREREIVDRLTAEQQKHGPPTP